MALCPDGLDMWLTIQGTIRTWVQTQRQADIISKM